MDEIEVAEDTSKPVEHKPSSTTRVLADGTYATETVYSSTLQEKEKIAKIRAAAKAPLRGQSRPTSYDLLVRLADPFRMSFAALLLAGDFYTGSVLASSMTKLVLRFHSISKDAKAVNALRAEVRFFPSSLIWFPPR